jgi:hypothetical protein
VVYLLKLTGCSRTDRYPVRASRAAVLPGKSSGSEHDLDFLQLRFVDPRVIEIVASLNIVCSLLSLLLLTQTQFIGLLGIFDIIHGGCTLAQSHVSLEDASRCIEPGIVYRRCQWSVFFSARIASAAHLVPKEKEKWRNHELMVDGQMLSNFQAESSM